jgi:hypothetical protein
VISIRGKGNAGLNGGPAGDLQVQVTVRPHPVFDRQGYDILCELPLTFAQLALGGEIQIPTLEGKISQTIREGTQPGEIIRLKGKGGHGGIPHRNTDPIVAMAAVIQALQTIVSRNVSPTDSGVVSICSVKAGTVGSQNVIPDEAVLYGTVRAYDNGTRHIYTLRDEDGNCYVWKTSQPMGMWDEDDRWVDADEGDTVIMRATVKDHGEYKGTKQTVITRPKIAEIRKVG